MKKIHRLILVLVVSSLSGCAAYFDALGYKSSESGPVAQLHIINQNDSGQITAWVFTNSDCTGGMRIFSAPIAMGGNAIKTIDANKMFTFMVGGRSASSDRNNQYVCDVYASFTPGAGKTYYLTYRGVENKCSLQLLEQAANGQRQPAYLQKKSDRTPRTNNRCE